MHSETAIVAYCLKHNIRYFPFGSTRLKADEKAGKEPDKTYAFHMDKKKPDLAIEVNVTSGSIDDLAKYRYLAVQEVWIWERGKVTMYLLDDKGYQAILQSHHLPGIDSERLGQFATRGIEESPLDLVREFFRWPPIH